MKSCLNCKHAEWLKTAGGRLHPSGEGKCKFPYKLPPLPTAMYWISKPFVGGGYINRRKELKDHCPHFAREERAVGAKVPD